MMYSRASIIFLMIITLLFVKGGISMYQKERQSRKNMVDVEKRLNDARLRQAELENSLNRLNSPDGVENEIRTKYNVKKAGEEVVLVVEPKETATTTIKSKGLWVMIFDWFRDIF